MSSEKDMFHPAIDMDVELQTNLKQKFVEDAFALLMKHKISMLKRDPRDDSISGTYSATERLDIEQGDGTSVGVRLRLVEDFDMGESLACTTALDELEIEDDVEMLSVISFEYCKYESPDDIPEESKVKWKPYVLIMIAVTDAESMIVLNGESGKMLDDQDLMQAHIVLSALRDQLNTELLLDARLDHDMKQPEVLDEFGNRRFQPGEFIKGNECPQCGSHFAYCAHESNSSSLN
jgi:hypothetical protein